MVQGRLGWVVVNQSINPKKELVSLCQYGCLSPVAPAATMKIRLVFRLGGGGIARGCHMRTFCAIHNVTARQVEVSEIVDLCVCIDFLILSSPPFCVTDKIVHNNNNNNNNDDTKDTDNVSLCLPFQSVVQPINQQSTKSIMTTTMNNRVHQRNTTMCSLLLSLLVMALSTQTGTGFAPPLPTQSKAFHHSHHGITTRSAHSPMRAVQDSRHHHHHNENDNLVASSCVSLLEGFQRCTERLALSAALIVGITAQCTFMVPPALAESNTMTTTVSDSAPVETIQTSSSSSKTATTTVYSPIDEVWSLINKYYIDQTFNGLDWQATKLTYKAKEVKTAVSNNDDSIAMPLVVDMVKSLGDKYTRVLDKSAYAAIQKFDLIGVGATLMPNEDKQLVIGAPPVPGSAADKAGLQIGDFIDKVNGVATAGRNAFDIIDQIAEDPNAKTVVMTVRTQGPDDIKGEGYSRTVTLPREFTSVKNPIYYKVSETRSDGTKVGYIRIKEFNSLVKTKLMDALDDLEKVQHVNALVLDLRGNPGGAFQSAVEISSLFFSDRVATYVVDNSQNELPFRTSTNKVLVDTDEPIAVWVDGFSASASEVFAGSLHDNCRAVVMGDKSFGKGLIQAVYGLKNGAGLVLTVAKYVTPNGSEIQGVGITPDLKGGVPPRIPGMDTDTSRVDFGEINKRLSPAMCTVPYQHPEMKSITESGGTLGGGGVNAPSSSPSATATTTSPETVSLSLF